ncbi:MAG: immunoglobulin domain-containing protein [Verrucomicrobiae bacterium]|nr:immunoglobulin domain-containing protein [Verrucomicrobiae bacterium]
MRLPIPKKLASGAGARQAQHRRRGWAVLFCALAIKLYALDLCVSVDPAKDAAELRWYPSRVAGASQFLIECFDEVGKAICTEPVRPDQGVLVLSNVSVRGMRTASIMAVSADGAVMRISPREPVVPMSPHGQVSLADEVHIPARRGLSLAPVLAKGAAPVPFQAQPLADAAHASAGSSSAGDSYAQGAAAKPTNNNTNNGPKADVVFLVDVSGSMVAILPAVYSNILSFVEALDAVGIDYQLGLVLFGQAADDGAPQVIGGTLTPDKDEFGQWLEPLNGWEDWGGTEPGLGAIRHAIQTYRFRSNAHRAFILISDEDSDDLDKTSTINLILQSNVVVHTAVDCTFGESASHYCDETSVRGVSAGILIQPIEGPYEDVIFTMIGTPPIIRGQPAGQTNFYGATVTLYVSAIGAAPMSYQWRKGNANLTDGDRIAGTQGPMITISNVFGGDSGGYSVVVSNFYGCVTSAVAVLTVLDPVVTNQPAELAFQTGETIELAAGALGTSPLRYQWRKNGVNLINGGRITGATNQVLRITNCYGADSGLYSVTVSNQFGYLTNVVATVTVADPVITMNPTNQNRNIGQTATFSVLAAGTPPIAYQWFKEAAPIQGATNTTLVITNLQAGHAGAYCAVASNIFGTATSAMAYLVVNLTEPDTGFNPGANGPVHCLALQPDGRIIVGGEFTRLGGADRSYLGRLAPNGAVDPTFSPIITGLGDTVVKCVAVLPNGKLLIGGYFNHVDGCARSNVARLNPDGTCDPTFTLGANRPVNCFALQPDGKVLVGGWFNLFGGAVRSNLARLNPDGTLDASFAPTIGDDESATVYSIAVQPDGKILVAGQFNSVNGQPRSGLVRLQSNGSLDPSFTNVPFSEYGFVECTAIQPDGKILIAGCFSAIGDEPRQSIARLNPDGTLDMAFNPGAGCIVDTLCIQTDGRIIVGGSFAALGGTERNCIGRLYPNGTLDPSFIPDVGVLYSSVHALSLQPDGNVLVGGRFTVLGGTARANLARLINTPPASRSFTLAGTTLRWIRSSTSPEILWARFEFSTNGTDWAGLGAASRVPGGWERAGVQFDRSGAVRALGCTSGGRYNGSSWFTVDEFAGPFLFAQPQSATNVVGSTATFSAVALGKLPLRFQWYKDGLPIAGATDTVLALPNVQTNHAGYYYVTVSNVHGAVTSAPAQLVVAYPAVGFANPAPIQLMQGVTKGAPYPSQIVVTGVWGVIENVWVTLSNLAHAAPADLDVLLVGPQGQKLMLMSDAGGVSQVTNVTLTFSSAAAAALPASGPLSSGHYRPTDYAPSESMPAPAPTGPYSTNLALLNGSNPNGTWSLFVADDNPDYFVGAIQSGWSLRIGIAPLPPPVIHTTDGAFGVTNGMFGFNVSGPRGWRVVVQASTNLIHWVPVQTNLLGTAPVYFSDTAAATNMQRFYRAVIVP